MFVLGQRYPIWGSLCSKQPCRAMTTVHLEMVNDQKAKAQPGDLDDVDVAHGLVGL